MTYANEQGFTLVELLVVVAIIGLLAAIAMPQFRSYQERSYDAIAIAVAQAREAMMTIESAIASRGYEHCEITFFSNGSAPTVASGSNTIEDCMPGFIHNPDVYISV